MDPMENSKQIVEKPYVIFFFPPKRRLGKVREMKYLSSLVLKIPF